jgi:hypothetical protein
VLRLAFGLPCKRWAAATEAAFAEADAKAARRILEAFRLTKPLGQRPPTGSRPPSWTGSDEKHPDFFYRLQRESVEWEQRMRELQAEVALQEARAAFAAQEVRRLGGRGSGGGAASGGAGIALCVVALPPHRA